MFLRKRTPPCPTTLSVQGSDDLVRAGERARVRVEVGGADDGLSDGIEVYLRMLGWDNKRAFRRPLGSLPAALGTHDLEVEIPGDLAPACARHTEYDVVAELKRSAGRGVFAASVVDVIGRPEAVWWPEGERAAGDVGVDREVIALGDTVSGRAGAESVSVGPVLDRHVGLPGRREDAGRFLEVATAPVVDGAFSVVLPDDVPPTLFDGGEQGIYWEVRAGDGAFARFAVLDPEGRCGRRHGRPDKLLTRLAELAGDRIWN